MGGEEDGARFLSVMLNGRTRGDRLNPEQGKFLLDIRKSLFRIQLWADFGGSL